jgi:hypothetical protein
MNDTDRNTLELKYPLLDRVVKLLLRRDKLSEDEAWLTAGAIYAYTGIASIPKDIVVAAGANPKDYPKVVGQINDALRGNVDCTEQFNNVLGLLRNIELLPDYDNPGMDPTRMMDGYQNIAVDYTAGNVLLMAEVGSVCRHRPAPGYYAKQYRLHISGGLKDVTFLNAAQQELIYAPFSPYRVDRWRTGKVKAKKGNQAHEHIYLVYAPEDRAKGIDLSRRR